MDFIVNIVATEMLENNEFIKDLLDKEIVEEEDQVAEAMMQAKEYFEFNIANVGKGDGNEDAPIFLHSPQFDERSDDGQKV